MHTFKKILKSQKLFFIVLAIATLYSASHITYTTQAAPNSEIQDCDQKAMEILFDTFQDEDIFNQANVTPLNSEVSTETLERYKLYYDMAFDFCIHSNGYVS